MNSSYLKYLPPVLWKEPNGSPDFIGQFLLVFEKLLTSMNDGVVISHGDHTHEDFESVLDRLSLLFNPWKTRAELLDYLATWVALAPEPFWSEYQKRKIIGEIVQIHALRGSKRGLRKHLEIHAAGVAQPRIAIDDGDTVFRIEMKKSKVLDSYAIANGPPLLHPRALAIDALGNLLIADEGDEGLSPPAGPGSIPASLWRFSQTGAPQFASSPKPIFKPIHQGNPLYTPTAVIAEPSGAIVVVDTGTSNVPPNSPPISGIYRFSPPLYQLAIVIDYSTVVKLPAIYPVGMVRLNDGRLVVLNRGARFPNPATPQIIIVQESPLSVTQLPLGGISEPTAIAITSSGKLVITDAGIGPPTPAEPTGALLPADVFLVDITTNPPTKTSLISGVAGNPLIYPNAVIAESANAILVSDLGVKPPGRMARLAAPAALYRIPLPPQSAAVELVRSDASWVWPVDIELDVSGNVIVLDHGESQDQAPARSWRSLPHEFGVIVYFSESRPVAIGEKRKILGSISRVINLEKPAHINWTLKNNQL